MQQKTIYILGAIILVIGAFFLFSKSTPDKPEIVESADYKNINYTIEGESVQLKDGKASSPAEPSSASMIVTEYFGNEAKGDLNGDGMDDLAFILTQNSGGTGTFYYLVGAVQNEDGGYTGTAGVLLGDRIAPQSTEIRDGKVIVNYADRAPGESFVVAPSVGKSIWLKLDLNTMQFGEVVQNFAGEADPSKMTLDMKAWSWISARYNDGRKITPKQTGKFTLTFAKDGRFSATTDCNSMGGTYVVNKNNLSFGAIVSTKMFCEGSQEADFATLLTNTQSYHFTSKGELVLDLKLDSGSVVFK